jgi:hypothetical protein
MLAGALLWLLAALVLGGSGALLGLRPSVLLLLVASLAIVLVVASVIVPTLRRFVVEADLRLLASFHLFRFVGLYLVVLGARGLLPGLFVVAAGWGNLAVAVLALLLIVLVPPQAPHAGRWWLVWNLFGLLVSLAIGIVLLVLGASGPGTMLRVLPWSLLPSFVAPIAVATHVWMLLRLAHGDRGGPSPRATLHSL